LLAFTGVGCAAFAGRFFRGDRGGVFGATGFPAFRPVVFPAVFRFFFAIAERKKVCVNARLVPSPSGKNRPGGTRWRVEV
jgi:hypothetical protein